MIDLVYMQSITFSAIVIVQNGDKNNNLI